jgi:hypothetical protein
LAPSFTATTMIGNGNCDAEVVSPPLTTPKKTRVRLTIAERMEFVRHVDDIIQRGDNSGSNKERMTLIKACREAKVLPQNYIYWKQRYDTMSITENKNTKSKGNDRTSELASIQPELLSFISDLANAGKKIKPKAISSKASALCSNFRKKKAAAQARCMGRFLRAMRLKFGPNVEEWLEKYQHATTSSMPANNIPPPLVDDADDTFDGPSGATSVVDISTQGPTQNNVVETSDDPPLAGPTVGGVPHDSSGVCCE